MIFYGSYGTLDILLILAVALVIDFTLGELPGAIHPVVWMGRLVSLLDRMGNGRSRITQFVYGAFVSLLLIGLFTAATFFGLLYLKVLSFPAYVLVGAVLLKTTFSFRELRRAAIRVKQMLAGKNMEQARSELRSLVSRDTGDLAEPLLISATVESVAENTCDSFVAPLFYYLLFGIPGAMAYRVVNTLDAMIGYHGQHEYSGKFASRLDDVLNFIPARITALLIMVASLLCKTGVRAAWQVAHREHAKTESPNAGWTMAAVAGALDVQLEKPGQYKLGRAGKPLTPGIIDASLRLVQVAALVWVIICFIAGVVGFVITT